jgi:hypothetical protein
MLIGLKGWKFIKPVVDFLPLGTKFNDLIVILSGETCGCTYTFSVFEVGYLWEILVP